MECKKSLLLLRVLAAVLSISLGAVAAFAIEPVTDKGARGMYAVTVQLTDDVGYWAPPSADGDLLLQLTWRGMGSNRVRLGLGQVGGGPADDAGAMPSPPNAVAKIAKAV